MQPLLAAAVDLARLHPKVCLVNVTATQLAAADYSDILPDLELTRRIVLLPYHVSPHRAR